MTPAERENMLRAAQEVADRAPAGWSPAQKAILMRTFIPRIREIQSRKEAS